MDAEAQHHLTIERVIQFGLLYPVFQPVFSMSDGAVFGFEGLIRGPRGTRLESPAELFALAEGCGMRTALEVASARAIFRAFSRKELPGYLMVNFSAVALADICKDPKVALRDLQDGGIAPQNVIIELTEQNRIDSVSMLAATLQPLTRAGISIALDDFGAGHSNLQLWMELRPRLVKLDHAFSNGLSTNGDKFEIVRLLKSLSDSFGAQLVAEGVESPSDLAVVRDMGIPLVQGFLLARPAQNPASKPNAEAQFIINSRAISTLPERKREISRFRLAGELGRPVPPMKSTVTNEELRRFFKDHSEWHGVAVVDDGRTVGVVDRRSFMDRYAQPFQRELFGRRSLTHFMNECPLVIERRTPVESLASVLTGKDQRYLSNGFVVVDNGRYVGLATGEDLVRAVTELRVEAARYANPLTFLPGNIPISQHLDRLLAAHTTFVACYADLANFKPFNDQYGYWRGDEVIRLAAGVIQANADPTLDFVGHVGGDDFLIVFQSDDWEPRARRIIEDFNAKIIPFFDESEVTEQGFWGEDRKGLRAFFSLTSMVIGAVIIEPGSIDNHEDVASAAAAAKRMAKKSAHNMHIDRSIAKNMAAAPNASADMEMSGFAASAAQSPIR